MKALIAVAALIALMTGPEVYAQTNDLTDEGPSKFDSIPSDAVSPFGGLSLTPTRLVLSPHNPLGRVTLYNSGGDTVTYRIEDVELEALGEGGYAPMAEEAPSPEWSAARYLRYAPRQVTLGPGERQVVKIISRAPRDMGVGEYRSHLRFSSIPVVAPVEEQETKADDNDSNSVGVKVGLEYRITIPVILRTGRGENGTRIQSAHLTASPDSEGTQVDVVLTKTAAWGDYGTLRVLDAAGEEIGLLRGVSVLPPLKQRTVSVPIRQKNSRAARVVFEVGDGRDTEQVAVAAIN